MEIKRVNEYTLRFFITYRDMENRGFDREEIWYNRERGEELFWEMMDEAHHEEEFPFEGPLWIQVQALEKGLEIIVTKAQFSKDGSKLELPLSDDKQLDLPVDENIESMVDQQVHAKKVWSQERKRRNLSKQHPKTSVFLIGFDDFEDLVQLSHYYKDNEFETNLYFYDGHYYLHIVFPNEQNGSRRWRGDQLSILMEYGFNAELTTHFLKEYGHLILSGRVFDELRKYFPSS